MRRVGLAVVIAATALVGCNSFREVFTSHADTAARVGDRQLKSASVANMITRAGGAGANPQAAELVANIWVDLQLFGQSVARGTLKPDSALFDRLLWPQLAQAKSSAWHDTLLAHRTVPSVDSLYNLDEVRLFQHILIQPAGSTAADTAKALAQAQRVLPQARSDFGKAAAQFSSDQANKGEQGYLPVAPRGAFVPEFDTVAWKLAPGEMSGVVKSGFGFHIIRRPPLSEVRDRFTTGVKQAQQARGDSIYFAELGSKNEIKVKPGAAAAARSAVSDLSAARRSSKELVSFRNGGLSVGDFARWMTALAPQQLAQVRQASDSMLIQFLTSLAQNTILLREADSAGIKVSPTTQTQLVGQFTTMMDDLKQQMGLTGAEFADSSKTPPAERVKLAGEKVDEYFDKLSKGQVQFRQVPPTLSAELRATGDYKVYQAGVARAAELIMAKRSADSAAGAAAPQAPPAGLQPAPGGPPTPGKKP